MMVFLTTMEGTTAPTTSSSHRSEVVDTSRTRSIVNQHIVIIRDKVRHTRSRYPFISSKQGKQEATIFTFPV